MPPLEIGNPAPTFTLPTDGGGTVSLADLKGKAVVLYLYPRDDTPGCTKEAIGFSEHIEAFEAANAVILGLSRDTPVKHDSQLVLSSHGKRLKIGSFLTPEERRKLYIELKQAFHEVK